MEKASKSVTRRRRRVRSADEARSLQRAAALLPLLREGPLDPVIVLLAQPWFGADEQVPTVPGLRGLFVQYPGRPVRPALAGHCERWASVPSKPNEQLAEVLARLLG